MKVTFEFEHPYQLIDLLEALTKAAIERHSIGMAYELELDNMRSVADTEHDLCDAPNCT